MFADTLEIHPAFVNFNPVRDFFLPPRPLVEYVFSQRKTIPKAFGFEAATQ
jgi:hypothetical protein